MERQTKTATERLLDKEVARLRREVKQLRHDLELLGLADKMAQAFARIAALEAR